MSIMVKHTSTGPTPRFPTHSEPRVWLLSSGESPIAIALSRQLLAHGDYVVHGTKPVDVSSPGSYRAADFTTFWTEEVLVNEGWKDRARTIGLDGRCEVALAVTFKESPLTVFVRTTETQANVKLQ